MIFISRSNSTSHNRVAPSTPVRPNVTTRIGGEGIVGQDGY